MIRYFIVALLSAMMVFQISCSSKKKKGEGAGGDVTSKPMNFDPMGSDSGKINGLGSVNFAYDRAALSAESKSTLKSNADWIKNNSGVTIQVEGHCDKRGSVEYNLALGERRAKAVKNYLVSLGVAAKRLPIISYGKEKLISYGDGEGDHAKNRRANFVPLQ